jgi:hypothetical protein
MLMSRRSKILAMVCRLLAIAATLASGWMAAVAVLSSSPAFAQVTPPTYSTAANVFVDLPLDQRIKFQVLLKAAG